MNGEYALTDEQKAAMQEEKNLQPDVHHEVAFKALVRNYPDLFDNTGVDLAKVRMNWNSFIPVTAGGESGEKT